MRRKNGFWLAVLVLAAVLCGAGCAGILAETVDEKGHVERVRVSTTDKWSSWNPHSVKQDESCFILKKESTF